MFEPTGSGPSSAIGLRFARPTLPVRTASEEPCQSGDAEQKKREQIEELTLF